MQKSDILTLYEYNRWANRLILDTTAKLSHEQYVAPAEYPWGGLRGTLVHTWNGEWIWRRRCQERVYPQAFIPEAEMATREELRRRWQEEEEKMSVFLASLTDEALNTRIYYEGFNQQGWEQKLWQILNHVVLHGMQHRSECAAMLTRLGHSPGNIDMIMWMRETGQ